MFLGRIGKYKWISLAHIVGLVLVLGGWILAWLKLREVDQPLVIHFNNYLGITRTGGLLDLAWLGVFGLLAISINFLVALDMEERDWFWGKALSIVSVLVAGLIFVGFLVIMSVN